MIIAADIGATKTDLAIYSPESGIQSPLAKRQCQSADYPNAQSMISEFLASMKIKVDCASLAVAGPVIDGCVRTTNLPWVLDEPSLSRDLQIPSVYLINDLEAVAWAVPILDPTDVLTLNRGKAVTRGAIAIIAPGTGLGESFLTWNGVNYVPHTSEGGHADFAPTTARQIQLLTYLRRRFDHVSAERVCSGIGIPNIYEFLRDVENLDERPEVTELIASAKDRTKEIIANAIDPQNRSLLCHATVELFLSILAGEAGNLVLKTFATGGLYLGGGLPRYLSKVLEPATFMRDFTTKGRFKDLMSNIPVHLIIAPAALIGAARYGLEMLKLPSSVQG